MSADPHTSHPDATYAIRRLLQQSSRCLVMGVLNVTPDSFSDGGRFAAASSAVAQGRRMVADGADLLDIGGESTRPGAASVHADVELERIIPVIERLRVELDVPLSVDTSKAVVMRAAVAAGATLINDVCSLQGDGALDAAAELGVPVCLMHMQGSPRTMQVAPEYSDVTSDVCDFLRRRIGACIECGIPASDLLVDPGFGFGKTLAQNLQLLRDLDRIAALGPPVLVGMSRKSMIGAILNKPVDERLHGSVALALRARQNGAAIIRVHDVGPTVDALAVWAAVAE